MEVTFAWQTGHRPNQRGTSYAIDGAFPDSLQPALLSVYRWVLDQWHQFIGLENLMRPQEAYQAPTERLTLHRGSGINQPKRKVTPIDAVSETAASMTRMRSATAREGMAAFSWR
jgi:hypothetical protein